MIEIPYSPDMRIGNVANGIFWTAQSGVDSSGFKPDDLNSLITKKMSKHRAEMEKQGCEYFSVMPMRRLNGFKGDKRYDELYGKKVTATAE